jgi:hypothetical protein
MIINHNCCIKLAPLVIFIYDAWSYIHQIRYIFSFVIFLNIPSVLQTAMLRWSAGLQVLKANELGLTLNLPTTTIVAQPFNVIKWQLNFNPVA